MIKRGAIIGIGTIILVIGLTGLGLLQTGVICPTEVKSPETAISQQSQGPVNQTAPAAAPAPQSGVSPGPKPAQTPQRVLRGANPRPETLRPKNRSRSRRLAKASAVILNKIKLHNPCPHRSDPERTLAGRQDDAKAKMRREAQAGSAQIRIETLHTQYASGSHYSACCDQVQIRSGAVSRT